jgi:hypothetical protein
VPQHRFILQDITGTSIGYNHSSSREKEFSIKPYALRVEIVETALTIVSFREVVVNSRRIQSLRFYR